LSSCTGIEDAFQKSEPEILPDIAFGVAGEAMIGEATIGEAMIGEATIDEATIDEATIGETMIGETMTGVAFAEAGQWGGPETILLVEDEGFVREATAEVLESAGYRLVLARSAAEALEACRRYSGPLHLVLADVVMPGMSGRELATELESFYPHARVLLMSGYAEQLVGCELSPCCKGYMAKPFSIGELLRRVREVLDQPIDLGGRA
jgi:CheY-like chemotaxis protein